MLKGGKVRSMLTVYSSSPSVPQEAKHSNAMLASLVDEALAPYVPRGIF